MITTMTIKVQLENLNFNILVENESPFELFSPGGVDEHRNRQELVFRLKNNV